MKLDLKKTVLLFASIHLLIAWVAERQGKMKSKMIKTISVVAKEEKAKAKSAVPDKYFGLIYSQP